MKKIYASLLTLLLTLAGVVPAQQPPQPPQQGLPDDQQDIVRITTDLVQVDAVVVDKNDKPITDLTLADFKLTENGKRQELKFMEFVSGDASPRTDGAITVAGQPIEPEAARNLTAGELRRVFAFVVDDLTIPLEDITTVRNLLTSFVDNQMREGDLVGIVRVVGGNGLLQQFTSDKRILRRAIAQITPRLHAYSAFNNLPTAGEVNTQLLQAIAADGATSPGEAAGAGNTNLDASDDGATRGFRALSTLVTAGEVINSMKSLPGRKNLVLLSGGLPINEYGPTQVAAGAGSITIVESRYYFNNVLTLLRQLTDRASRAGVVINTMDVRGLKANRGVARFTDPGNEATSALFGGAQGGAGFGRQANPGTFDNLALDTISGHQGLGLLADTTGGVSVVNSDNFDAGLQRVMARSSYYLLAYRPSEPFDGKFHKYEIKVNRPGAKVYYRQGYYANADAPATKSPTKEQAIIRAATSPLARRDVNMAGTIQYRFAADNRADIDINLVIDANDLDFKQDAAGKYHTTFDVVGFVVNSLGRTQDGFSQTVTANFAPEEYQRAQTQGISFTGHALLPPGNYQLRAVVREAESGRLGSVSQYLEVPDLTKKRLTMSSLFLYGVDLAQGNRAEPTLLNPLRQLPRKLDLRYAAVIYNPKLQDGKPQVRAQLLISRDGKIVFQEPEQPVPGSVQNGQMAKVGQFSLAKARPGRYVLTLVVTDPLADRNQRIIVRSIDFNLVD